MANGTLIVDASEVTDKTEYEFQITASHRGASEDFKKFIIIIEKPL